MHNGIFRPIQRSESPFDDVWARLSEHLDGHVVGDQIPFDQGAAELVFRFGRRGKADFNLFKSNFNKQIEKIKFFFQAHGHDQRLIAVAQIDTAPDRRFLDIIPPRPVDTGFGRHKIIAGVLLIIFHDRFPSVVCLFAPICSGPNGRAANKKALVSPLL